MNSKIFLITLLVFFSCAKMDEDSQNVEPRVPKDEYTAEDAGEWEAIKEDHLPTVNVEPKEGTVNIKLDPKKFNPTHYIERIGIMTQDKVDLASQPLTRESEPKASFVLKPFPDNLEKTKIYVKCNLHDLWTVTLAEAIAQSRRTK